MGVEGALQDRMDRLVATMGSMKAVEEMYKKTAYQIRQELRETIKDQYKLKGSVSPFDYEMENIKSVILNKRRQELIESLEKGVFENAKRQNKVKVYVDNK